MTFKNQWWARSQEDECLALWGNGLTADAIGARIGKSRCAVLGKLYRLREILGEKKVPFRSVHYPRREPEPIKPALDWLERRV